MSSPRRPSPTTWPAGVVLGLAVALALVATASSPTPAAAQARVSPADSAAVLLDAAETFAAQGRVEVADALYRLILRRYPGTPQADAARAAIAVLGPVRPSSGSTELQVWSTLYGALLGVVVPGSLGAESAEAYGAGLLLGAPLGFITSRAYARRANLTVGQARAITWGGTWGTWQGIGWRSVLDIGEGLDCDGDLCTSGDASEETFAAMAIGGLSGIAAGALLGRAPISDGQATGANLGSLWGTWFGLAFGVLTDLDGDDLLASTLITGNAGLVAGALATPALGWSRNRWRAVSAGGAVGGLAGFGLSLIVNPDSEQVGMGITLGGSLLGLALGVGLSEDEGDGIPDNAAGGPGEGALGTGALLDLSLGSPGRGQGAGWQVGLPLPTLRQLPVEMDGRVRWRPRPAVTWLRVAW